jgi:hypothetical protein
MPDEIKNVFISHLHEDDAGLADLKKLIEKGGLTVRDASINSSNPNNAKDPDYIKSQILAPQIQWASTLVVYITPQTKDRVGQLGNRVCGKNGKEDSRRLCTWGQ